MLRALLLAILASHAATALPAQDQRWQVTLDGQEYVWDIRLVRLEGDSLIVREADTLRSIPVKDITEVRLIKKTEVQLGGGGAGAMSALMGGDDEVYDLTPLEFADRLRAIQKILLYHPVEPQDSP
jgi:hypothetical protein